MKLSYLLIVFVSLSVVAVVPIEHAEGQCRVNEGGKVTASDAGVEDLFGWSVFISDHVAVVGAIYDDDAGTNSGSAYVYRLEESTWVEEQKLIASDAAAGDLFGCAVAVSGSVAVVGAYDDDDAGYASGSAYVFRFDGSAWIEEQKLTASDGAWADKFGISVSVSGDVALVGAWFDDDAGTNSGSAYVYRFDGKTWVEEQKLIASDAAAGDLFGWSASISGDVAIVGAYWNDAMGADSGAAYVYRFEQGSWVEEQKLAASDGATSDFFGNSVSISGDVALVGAFYCDGVEANSGNAYVYRFDGSTWVEEQKLAASDAAAGDQFGISVSIGGDAAVVGAYADDNAGIDSGAAYVYGFDQGSWVEEQKLTASDGAAADHFGYRVSISGGLAVVGARGDDDACSDDLDCYSGSAYAFGINPTESDPPCGAIDARQPSAPDGSGAAGWSSVALTFDEPPDEMFAEDFTVVISPPGDAPAVTDVAVDENTATVYFDDFIPTEAWTTITHWPTGSVTRVGYLPADVNNDKLSNANDVRFLIDVLNGVIDPLPEYQTDTDRSGATNPSDVLRVIDLLNGAGVYDVYLGATLPE